MVDELEIALEAAQNIAQPLRQGEFNELIGKVLVYIQSMKNSWIGLNSTLRAQEQTRTDDLEAHRKAKDAKIRAFQASLKNSVRFAHINLDAALAQALETLVCRPRNPTKTDEHKKAIALQKTFDRMDSPANAMLEHFRNSSDPLNKYLVAGPWGHEYLRKRKIDLEEYDRNICEILAAHETAAGKIVLAYAHIKRSLEALEKEGLSHSEALQKSVIQN
jgi:hypothetical protein